MRKTEEWLAGKVVVITGATSGIGWALAVQAKLAGATVIGTGRDPDRLMALAQRVDRALSMEVTDPRSVEVAVAAVVDAFGRIDVLVNNAGVGLFRSWEETTEEDLTRILEVNLVGVARVSRAFLPTMIAQGGGNLIAIASVAGRRGYPLHSAYCASKHGLIGWSRALRKELAGTGVQVTVLCPPVVDTPFFANAGYSSFKEERGVSGMMTADTVAAETWAAAGAGARMRLLGRRAKVLWWVDALVPGLVDVLQRWR